MNNCDCSFIPIGVMNCNSPNSGIDYSYEEQDTGLKWVDGRKIYQKTIPLNNPIAVDTYEETPHEIEHADFLFPSMGSCIMIIIQRFLAFHVSLSLPAGIPPPKARLR